jgi:hypothetical protein
MAAVVSGLVLYAVAAVVTGSQTVGILSVAAAAAARVAGYPVPLLVLAM